MDGRIMPGPHRHECTDGRAYSLDRELSDQQLAVLHGLLRREGLESREVRWVDFHGEAPPHIERLYPSPHPEDLSPQRAGRATT